MSLSRLVVWMNKTLKTIYYFFKNDKIFFLYKQFPLWCEVSYAYGEPFSSILDSHNKTC